MCVRVRVRMRARAHPDFLFLFPFLFLCLSVPRWTSFQVFAMDELTLGLALQTIQRRLPQFVTMSWRKVPLLQEQLLLNRAIESLAKELEWGLDAVESLTRTSGSYSAQGGGCGNAHIGSESTQEWLRLQIETDLAVTELCSI